MTIWHVFKVDEGLATCLWILRVRLNSGHTISHQMTHLHASVILTNGFGIVALIVLEKRSVLLELVACTYFAIGLVILFHFKLRHNIENIVQAKGA